MTVNRGKDMATQRTHDYRRDVRGWGHDITYTVEKDGKILNAQGWGDGLRPGDFILLSNGKDETRYRVKKITYYGDPKDMWKATLKFAPRAG